MNGIQAWNTRMAVDQNFECSTSQTLKDVLGSVDTLSESETADVVASTKAMVRSDQEPLYRLFVELGKRQPKETAPE